MTGSQATDGDNERGEPGLTPFLRVTVVLYSERKWRDAGSTRETNRLEGRHMQKWKEIIRCTQIALNQADGSWSEDCQEMKKKG